MTPPPQRTYVRKDGTLVPHTSRPLSARFSDLLSSLVLFLTLFWQTLFQVTTFRRHANNESGRNNERKSSTQNVSGGSTLGGGGGGGGSGNTSGSRRFGTIDDIRSRMSLSTSRTNVS